MPEVQLDINGTKKLQYSYQVSKGIYFVHESKLVKKNCELLNIVFSDIVEEKITSFKNVALVTTKAGIGYVQCILLSSALKEDVSEFANELPNPAKQNIPLAYSLISGKLPF
jgi:hypothetical protein